MRLEGEPRWRDAGPLAQTLAPVLWLPQAALLAWAVGRLQAGGGVPAVMGAAAGLVVLGLLRAAAEAWGAGRVFDQARAQLGAGRSRAAQALAARSPLDRRRAASGAAASALAEQAEALLPWLTRYRLARWRVMLVPPVLLLAVASLSWVAALILLVAAPLIPLFMAIVGWRAQAASQAQLQQWGDAHSFLLDRLRGLATLRTLGAVDRTAERLHQLAELLRARTMAVLRIAFLSSAVLELFAALGVAMVAAYVGLHLLGQLPLGAWGGRLSLAEGLFILLLAPAFFEPLRELSAAWHDRAAGEAAQQALDRLTQAGLPLPGAGADPAAPAQPRGGPPAVHLRGVGFGFPARPPLFEQFDLHVQPGEHVALWGDSGAGKTALLALLAGLLPATRGEIVVGGVALGPASAARWRERMAWMGQRPHVFAGSVQSNVSMGRVDVDLAQVQQAIARAGLERVAQAQPGAGLGEGGQGLSGGEAVRLALARLVVASPRADLLLLDEPTAHLDSHTALQIAGVLRGVMRGRTAIVATHDPVLAAAMDRVIRLDAALPQRKVA